VFFGAQVGHQRGVAERLGYLGIHLVDWRPVAARWHDESRLFAGCRPQLDDGALTRYTNNALTAASQQEGPQALAGVKSYFDTHQQAGKDLQVLQQPLTGLTGKCNLPVSLPQVLQMMQGAQQQGLPGPGVPVLAPALSPLTPAAPTPTAPAVSSVR
jgi:hemophore-related protein